VAALILCVGPPLVAQVPETLPHFQRSDPRIRIETFLRSAEISVVEKRVGVFEFVSEPQGSPPSPDLAPYFQQALWQQQLAIEAVWLGPVPALSAPTPAGSRFDQAFILAASQVARTHGVDVVLIGRTQRVVRTISGGLTVKATLWLVHVEGQTVLWHGRFRADWLRHFPLEDCLLHAAWWVLADLEK
jgi:hypothetical protein